MKIRGKKMERNNVTKKIKQEKKKKAQNEKQKYKKSSARWKVKVPNLLFTMCIARSLSWSFTLSFVRSFVLLRNFVAKLAAVAAAASLLCRRLFLSSILFLLYQSDFPLCLYCCATFVWHSERNWATKSRFHEKRTFTHRSIVK